MPKIEILSVRMNLESPTVKTAKSRNKPRFDYRETDITAHLSLPKVLCRNTSFVTTRLNHDIDW